MGVSFTAHGVSTATVRERKTPTRRSLQPHPAKRRRPVPSFGSSMQKVPHSFTIGDVFVTFGGISSWC